jgi:hypothetical protein
MKIKCISNEFNWAGFHSGNEYEIVDISYDKRFGVHDANRIIIYLIGDLDEHKRMFNKAVLIKHFDITDDDIKHMINKILVFQ